MQVIYHLVIFCSLINLIVATHVDSQQELIYQKQRALLASVKSGDLANVQKLLNDEDVDPSFYGDAAIQSAAVTGRVDIVDALMQDPRVDASTNNNYAIERASCCGHANIVDRLLRDPNVDPTVNANAPLCSAAFYGHVPVVRRLLKEQRISASARKTALLKAMSEGNVFVVEILIRDPCMDALTKNKVIRWAAPLGHLQIIDELLQDPQVDPASKENYALGWSFYFREYPVVNRLLQDQRIMASLPDHLSERISNEPRPFLKAYAQTLCERDGIPSSNFLCRLFVIVVTRKLSVKNRLLSLWRKDIQTRYKHSIGYRIQSLWKMGHFQNAMDSVESLWTTWKWKIQKRQAEFRYHPKRVDFTLSQKKTKNQTTR